MNIQIDYNRTAKEYEWVNPHTGEVHTAPAKAKADLFRAAVAMLDPDLYAHATAVLSEHPQLERVLWRGVELVASEAVEVLPAAPAGVVAMVESSDEYGRYALEATEHGITCQCVHFADGYAPLTQTGSRVCKHIAAYHLHMATREDRF